MNKTQQEKINTGDKTTDMLYEATRDYIKKKGGSVIVIGGIAIMKEPSDLKYNYSLVIRVTGKLPKLPKKK